MRTIEPSRTLARDSSWVIVDRKTGDAVLETYSAAVVANLNTAKYVAIGAGAYLCGLNKGKNKRDSSTK